MRRAVAMVAFVLTGTLILAQDPPPAAPPVPVAPPVPARPVVQPAQPVPLPVPPRLIMGNAARVAQLEEEMETLEAALDVKKAHVKAAEVSVDAAKARHDLVVRAVAGSQTEVQILTAKFDHELAKAQLGVRQAEVKEVEVKVKYAKKRLDEAKPAVRPQPGGVRPVPVDPR